MNLSPLTVSISAEVLPTAEIAVTAPSQITVSAAGVTSLTADIDTAIPAIYMSFLDFSMTGSGGVEVGGAAYVTGNPFVWAGSGGTEVGGGADVSVSYSMAASGGVQAGGSAASSYYALDPRLTVTFPPMSASATGSTNTLAVRFRPLAAAATGILGNVGSLDAHLPALRARMVAGVQVMDVVLPTMRAAATGSVGVLGAANVVMPRLRASMSASGVYVGAVSVRLPAMTAAAAALAGRAGAVGARLYPMRVDMLGQPGIVGVLAPVFPYLVAHAGGYSRIEGELAATAPLLAADLEGTLRLQMQLFLVANTQTQAPSTYEGVDVNSMIFFNGQTLFADATGIHVLDADDDNGSSIDAEVTFGKLDLGSRVQKRVPEAFIGLRADGDMNVEVNVDEQETFAYTLTTESVDRLKERRAKLGRGLKGMYWQFSLKNVEGCDFTIDKIELPVQDNDRKL